MSEPVRYSPAAMLAFTRDVLSPRLDPFDLRPVMSLHTLVAMLKTVPAGKVLDGIVISNESVPLPVLVTTSVKVTVLPWLAALIVSIPLMVPSLSFAATPVSLIVTLAL